MSRSLEPPDTTEQIGYAIEVIREVLPIVARLSPTAALAVGAAIAALELLLAEPEPTDAQDVVTPRPDVRTNQGEP